MAGVAGAAPVVPAPVVPVLGPPAGAGVLAGFIPPSAVVSATVNVHNRQIVWQLLRYESRMNPRSLGTQFHLAFIRARNSIKNQAAVVDHNNYRQVVWVNRSRRGLYVWRIVEAILQTMARPGQPACIRQMPHPHPGTVLRFGGLTKGSCCVCRRVRALCGRGSPGCRRRQQR